MSSGVGRACGPTNTRAVAQWLESMRLYKQTHHNDTYDYDVRGGLACNSYLCVMVLALVVLFRIKPNYFRKYKFYSRAPAPAAAPRAEPEGGARGEKTT